tara:strand:+ start:309 stop:515 length:207 start_codon:yes stop_codon:yes gene_type:complete
MDIEKILKEYEFGYEDNRTAYDKFLDNMYKAYLVESEGYREINTLTRDEYFEANQDFLINKFKEINDE